MALSEHEQRLLDEMERRFYQSEADVVHTAPTRRRVNYRALVIGILVAIAGIGILIGGVATQLLWLGLIGFAVMLGGVTLMLSRTEAPIEGVASEGETRPRPSGGESFSERMERRWDQRMEGER